MDLHFQHILTEELFGFGPGHRATLDVQTSEADEKERAKSLEFDREQKVQK